MAAFTLLPRRCDYRLLLPLAVLLAGCHVQPAAHPTSLRTSAAAPASPDVQQDAAYKTAVAQFGKHDYSATLISINGLIAKPQYAQNPAAHAFLLHQQAICRHAIDPHLAADLPPASPAPLLPAHVPLTAAQADCGPRALLLLCPQFGVHADLDTLRRQAGTTPKGTTMQGLAHAAGTLGLKAKGVQVDRQALTQVPLPAIAWYDGSHYVDLLSVSEQQAKIRDPNKPKEEDIPTNELLGRSGGFLLTLSR